MPPDDACPLHAEGRRYYGRWRQETDSFQFHCISHTPRSGSVPEDSLRFSLPISACFLLPHSHSGRAFVTGRAQFGTKTVVARVFRVQKTVETRAQHPENSAQKPLAVLPTRATSGWSAAQSRSVS